MKLSDNDQHALIETIALFNVDLIAGREFDGEKIYERSVETPLPDAGYTLHLVATFVPRGAVVIPRSGGTVQGPDLLAAAVNSLTDSEFKMCPHGEMQGPGFAPCQWCKP